MTTKTINVEFLCGILGLPIKYAKDRDIIQRFHDKVIEKARIHERRHDVTEGADLAERLLLEATFPDGDTHPEVSLLQYDALVDTKNIMREVTNMAAHKPIEVPLERTADYPATPPATPAPPAPLTLVDATTTPASSTPAHGDTHSFRQGVERFISHHYRKEGLLLRTKWKGYSIVTSENLESALKAPAALSDYLHNLKARGRNTLINRNPILMQFFREEQPDGEIEW